MLQSGDDDSHVPKFESLSESSGFNLIDLREAIQGREAQFNRLSTSSGQNARYYAGETRSAANHQYSSIIWALKLLSFLIL